MRKPPISEARQRILDAASSLFYARGIHAVGIDEIVSESATAKMTLYKYFASKDALVVAWLEHMDRQYWEWWHASVRVVAEEDHLGRLEAILRAIADLSTRPQCLGCVFQLTAAEYPKLTHAAHRRAIAHKTGIINWLRSEAEAADLTDPDRCAGELYLLVEGVWASVRMFGTDNPGRHFVSAARAVLLSHQKALEIRAPRR